VPRLTLRVTCALLVAGVLARLAVLAWPGTGDVRDWEVESVAASRDLTAFYGLNGQPRVDATRVPDQVGDLLYPPIAEAEFAVVGHAYHALGRTALHSRLLTALVKLPGLAAELIFAGVLLWWRVPAGSGDHVRAAALAFWLNPVVWLAGSALGYADAQMAVPAVLGMLAASCGRNVLAGALVAIAALTKPQALLVVPAIVIMIRARPRRLSALIRFALAAGAASLTVLLPFLLRGAGPNLVNMARGFVSHDMLSGNAANVWWIVSWAGRTVYHAAADGWWAAITKPMSIVRISQWTEFGYPNPRVVGWLMVGACWLWGLWLGRRGVSLAGGLVFGAWTVYAYAMFAPQVHENHLYLAVICLTVAAALDRRVRAHWLATSAVFGLNLYLFYGLGNGAPPRVDPAWTGIDMTVLLAAASLIVFIRLTRFLPAACAASAPTPSPRRSSRAGT
jgi:hypothetical protein